jgi:hypothetical protein
MVDLRITEVQGLAETEKQSHVGNPHSKIAERTSLEWAQSGAGAIGHGSPQGVILKITP